MVRIISQHLIQGSIDISVTTTLTELWRTRCHILGRSKDCSCLLAQSFGDIVRSKLTCSRQVTCQASLHRIACAEQTLDEFLYDGLTVFYDKKFVALCCQRLYLLFWQRILRNLDEVGVTAKCFFDIVICDAASQDARLAGSSLYLIIYAFCRCLLHGILLLDELHVLLPCDARQEHPLVCCRREYLLCLWLRNFDSCTRVSQTRHDTKHDRFAKLFRKLEAISHHVVGFLLIGWFQTGNKGKLGIEARVLFVLRRVHRGVVSSKDDESTFDASNGAVDESVSTDVHAHMLHANEGSLACIRHAKSCFHCRLLVRAPTRMNATFFGKRMALYVFSDFRAWCTRISVHATQSGIDGTKSNGFIT